MRVAFLLTGFYRSFKETQAAYTHWANYYGADVYISTWDRDEWAKDKNNYTRTIKQQDFADFVSSINLGSLSMYDLENYNQSRVPFYQNPRPHDVMIADARAREHGTFWANRLRDQWYLVAKGWEHIFASARDYDVVFRSRLDIDVRNLPLYNANCIVIPKDIGGWDYTDHMAFGDFKSMEKYCNFYYNMQTFYDAYNIDPTHAVEFPKKYMTVAEPRCNYIIDQRISYDIIK